MKKVLILFLFTLFISTAALAQQPSDEADLANLANREQIHAPTPGIGFEIKPHIEPATANNGLPEIPNIPRNFFPTPIPVHTPEINSPEITNTEVDIGITESPGIAQTIQVSEEEHTLPPQMTKTLSTNSTSEIFKTHQNLITDTGCSLSLSHNTKPNIASLLWLSSLSLLIIFKKFKKAFN